MKTLCTGLLLLAIGLSAAPAETWSPLFDGKTLKGWHRAAYVNGQAEYSVQDGCIVGTTRTGTPNSFLCADQEYADFILELEFLVPAGMNSGIQVRSLCDPQVNKGRVHGYQIEIDPSPRAWTAGIYDEGRRGWLYNLTHIEKERGKEAAEAARKAFQPDAWNQLRVEAAGPRLQTWLNGVPVADLEDGMTPRGVIALQVHATNDAVPKQIRWRNLRLQELAAAPPAADPWKALRAWRYAESRTALTAIESEVLAATGAAWDPLEARLLEVLADAQATPDARRFVGGLLGRKGSAGAVSGLAQCLGDKDVGEAALLALARMPHAEADAALAAALERDLPPLQRAALATVCGERHLVASLPALADALASPEPALRRASALAVGRIGGAAAEDLLRTLPDADGGRQTRAEALLLCAEQARRDQDPTRAERLCRDLMAPEWPDTLSAGALTVLVDTLGAAAVPEVIRALEVGPEHSRETAARLAATMPGDAVGQTVAAALDRLPTEAQAMALTALTQRRDPATASAAAALLSSPQEPVRLAAICLLREVGGPEHVPALATIAAGTGPTASTALQALARLRGNAVDQALVGAIRQDAPGSRNVALIQALAQRGSPEAVPLALGLLPETPDAEVQRAYWRVLRDLAAPPHLEALLQALAKAPDGPARPEAEKTVAECLRRHPDPAAASATILAALGTAPAPSRPALVALLATCRSPQALAALSALLKGPASDAALSALLKGPASDPQCRHEAVKGLANWPTPEPFEALGTYAEATMIETQHVLALRGCLRLLDLDAALPEAERQRRLNALADIARRNEEKELIRAARDAVRVLGLKCRSGKAIAAVPAGFAKGGAVYVDRPYTFTEVPPLLAQATLLSTAMEDKASKEADFITFTLTAPATVLVGYDGRAKTVPDWLKDWRRLETVLKSTDAGCPLNLFGKAFPAGPVALPGNNAVPGVGAMYVAGVLAAPLP